MFGNIKVALIMLGGALAIAAAPPPEARLGRILEGRVAGKPVNCISLRDIQSSEVVERTAIVYRVGSKLYVNRPSGGASSLDRDDILVTHTNSSQLCNIDVVRLVDSASRFYRGFVSLGEFVPYTKPER